MKDSLDSQNSIRKRSLEDRVANSSEALRTIVNRSVVIKNELLGLLKDIEEYEHHYCKDSLGRELNLNKMYRVHFMKEMISASHALITKVTSLNNKISMATEILKSAIL